MIAYLHLYPSLADWILEIVSCDASKTSSQERSKTRSHIIPAMTHHRFLIRYAVLLLALLSVNPTIQAAVRKARPTQKDRTSKTALPTQQEEFQKHVEREIADLKEDVYTRATWKKVQEVEQKADDTAGSMRVVMLSAGGIGLVLGCVVTVLVTKRMGRPDDGLKIT